MTMPRAWRPHAADRLAEMRRTDGADPAYATCLCPNCGEVRSSYSTMSQRNADQVVASWARSHPCYTNTATQRRRARAVAA